MRHVTYFAFGSNTDPDQMLRRCPQAEALFVATLHGYRLAFAGRTRRGGVATLEKVDDPTAEVHGVVYRMPITNLRALDRFEGHPHAYRRRTLHVVTSSGNKVPAHVYIKPVGVYAVPTNDYLGRIERGYEVLGLDTLPMYEAVCHAIDNAGHTPQGDLASPVAARVFVYGSLMQGFGNHHLLDVPGARFVGTARLPRNYTMIDLGSFPGVTDGGRTMIAGEVYEVDGRVLANLDRLEGHPTLYTRTTVTTVDGEEVQTYIWNGRHRGGVVLSGDWRRHTPRYWR